MAPDIDDMREYLRGATARPGFNQWMGPRIIKAEADELELDLDIRPEMMQHHGFVHGGFIAGFAGTAAAWSGALTGLQDVVTSNYSIQLLTPAKGEKLKAVAKPIRAGRSAITVEVKV